MTNHPPIRNPYISATEVESTESVDAQIAGAVRVGQIITFALAQGVLMITGIAVYMSLSQGAGMGGKADVPAGIFLVIGIVAMAGTIGASVAIRSFLFSAAVREMRSSGVSGRDAISVDADSRGDGPSVLGLVTRYRMVTIVSQALFEGGAMINAILMLIGGSLLHLVPIAVLFAMLLTFLPTRSRIDAYIQAANDALSL